MMKTPLSVIAALIMTCAAATTPTAFAASDPLATPAAIQQLVENHDYKTALLEINRVLTLQTTAAAAYDPFQLLMYKAECQLQLHNQPLVLPSLVAAKKQAFIQDFPPRAAEPAALARLIQQSKNYQYQPKAAGNPPPIPLVDRDRRKEAYKALLADDLPEALKRLKLLPSVKTLPQLLELATIAGNARALEWMANGESFQTAPLTRSVADQAEQLIDVGIDQMADRVTDITTSANQQVEQLYSQPGNYGDSAAGRPVLTRTVRRGLKSGEAAYLQSTLKNCDNIRASVVDLAQALIFETDTMKAIAAKSDALKKQASTTLHDHYEYLTNPLSPQDNTPSTP